MQVSGPKLYINLKIPTTFIVEAAVTQTCQDLESKACGYFANTRRVQTILLIDTSDRSIEWGDGKNHISRSRPSGRRGRRSKLLTQCLGRASLVPMPVKMERSPSTSQILSAPARLCPPPTGDPPWLSTLAIGKVPPLSHSLIHSHFHFLLFQPCPLPYKTPPRPVPSPLTLVLNPTLTPMHALTTSPPIATDMPYSPSPSTLWRRYLKMRGRCNLTILRCKRDRSLQGREDGWRNGVGGKRGVT